MDSKPTCVALIPARSAPSAFRTRTSAPGRPPADRLQYFRGASERLFLAAVVVSTDSQRYAEVSRYYGAEVPFLRPVEYSGDTSPTSNGWNIRSSVWPPQPPLRRFQHPAPHQSLPPGRNHSAGLVRVLRGNRGGFPAGRRKMQPASGEDVGGARVAACCRCCRSALPTSPGTAAIPLAAEVYVQNASSGDGLVRGWCSRRTIAGNVLMPFLTRDARDSTSTSL